MTNTLSDDLGLDQLKQLVGLVDYDASKDPFPVRTLDAVVFVTGNAPEPGINGGLVRRRGAAPAADQPVNAFVCTIGVADLDATLAKLPAAEREAWQQLWAEVAALLKKAGEKPPGE